MLEIQLHGKIALVTGATGQLGRVMVRTLADCGANVVICYHKNERQAMALKEEAEQKYGVRGLVAQVDLVQPDSVQQLHEQVLNVFGAPQILVHSAVSQIKNCNVLEQPLADYYNQFETIMIHNVNMVKTFAPAMMDQRYGRIIGINTECSMKCRAGGSAYAASKRAMDGLYRSLAKELGPYNITVNQVAPGWTISDREREHGDADPDRNYTQKVPMKRRGTDQEIANAVAFLASDLAGFINGVFLPVCGGTVMPAI